MTIKHRHSQNYAFGTNLGHLCITFTSQLITSLDDSMKSVKSSKDFIMENLHEFIKEERKEELNQLNQTIKTLLNKLVVTTGLSFG